MTFILTLCSCSNNLWFYALHPDITGWFSFHAGLPSTLMCTFARTITHLWRWAGNIAACRHASCVHLVISKNENEELDAPHLGPRDSEISYFFTLSSVSPSSGILNSFRMGADIRGDPSSAGTGPGWNWSSPPGRAVRTTCPEGKDFQPLDFGSDFSQGNPVHYFPHSFWKDPLESSFSSFIYLGHT